MLPALDTLALTDSLTREAYTLLRNWNAAYDAASLGATIFDHWLFRYRQRSGTSASGSFRIRSASSTRGC